ncbi:MAG: BCCT family transporter [Gammaproteobacteria bacterium]|nr:BCCT family transporter [Gammaproteobacteria bacterium]
MFKSPLLLAALTITGAIALWGILDIESLTQAASWQQKQMFTSRGWFVMLTASVQLIACACLAFSRFGHIKLGAPGDQPEFSTVSWLTMLFAAGMGVGLLFWGTAEPVTHYLVMREYIGSELAADQALFVTNFHWGLHAWAIYALTALVIAYFGFRKGCPQLISAPIKHVFGSKGWPAAVGGLGDLLAIVAIAIGLGGSVAMGVFQVQDGINALAGAKESGAWLTMTIFVVLCAGYFVPLTVDLGKGMARLSNAAMAIALSLLVFVLLAGPTHFLMSGIVDAIGRYVSGVIPQGFVTYTFFDERIENWFNSWTLTYMVWWLAWAPFVGVFIARISKGRTIREFVFGVLVVPTLFSIFWFGVFGGVGFYAVLRTQLPIMDVVTNEVSSTTFFVLEALPLRFLTIAGTVLAAFLFIVTSVVSAAYVLAMFSTGGDINPSVKIKLVWGVILGALALVMIFSGSIDAVKTLIAVGAMPFVFFVLLLMVCLLKALKSEPKP